MAGFEPTNVAVKVLCLTAWRHPNIYFGGVDKGARTLAIQNHNLALYQLNYIHHIWCVIGDSNPGLPD
jgi:hypothetical protein